MTYPHGGKYSNDPYYLTEAEERQLETWDRERDESCVKGGQAEADAPKPSPTAEAAVHGSPAGPLNLKLIDQHHWRSDCNRYYVCTSIAADHGRAIFMASFKSTPTAPVEAISELRRESLDDAVADCVAHFNKKQPRAAGVKA